MTIEQILASLQEIVERAKDRDFTDEEVAEYEGLERQLKQAQQTAEIRSRNEAYRVVSTPAGVPRNTTAKHEDTYERAFNHYLRTGEKNSDLVWVPATDNGGFESRAQTETTTGGGYLVPTTMRNKLVECIEDFGGLAPNVETMTTESGEPMNFPTLDDTANSGVLVAINSPAATGTGADLVFGQKSINPYRYVAPGADSLDGTNVGAAGLRVPVELLQDSAFDVEALIRRTLGRRIARKQAAHWATGTGSGQPQGITLAAGPSDTWTAAAPTYDDLIDAIHSLDPYYRANAKWAFNDATMAKIEKIKDSNNDPVWRPLGALIGDKPSAGMLLGYPVVIDNGFADYTDGSANKFGVFGDLREAYLIRRVRDIQMIVNPYSRMQWGQVEYWLWARAGGVVQNDCAVSVLKND